MLKKVDWSKVLVFALFFVFTIASISEYHSGEIDKAIYHLIIAVVFYFKTQQPQGN